MSPEVKPAVPINVFFPSWIHRLQNKGIKANTHFGLFLALLYESNGWWAAASSWCKLNEFAPTQRQITLVIKRKDKQSLGEELIIPPYYTILSNVLILFDFSPSSARKSWLSTTHRFFLQSCRFSKTVHQTRICDDLHPLMLYMQMEIWTMKQSPYISFLL